MKMRQKKEIENNTWARVVSEANEWEVELKNEKRNSISTSNHVLFCLSSKHDSPLLTRKANFINEWQ